MMYIYIYIYICLAILADAAAGDRAGYALQSPHTNVPLSRVRATPNLPTNLVGYRGLDSCIILI